MILRDGLADDIDALNLDLYNNLNDEVGQAGFATTQSAYEEVYLPASIKRVLNRHYKIGQIALKMCWLKMRSKIQSNTSLYCPVKIPPALGHNAERHAPLYW